MGEFLSPPPPPPSPSQTEVYKQSNPYKERLLSNIDLIIAQNQVKWEKGIWSYSEQLVLRKKINHCYIRKEAHWDMARTCAKKSKLINLPKLILSTVLASSLTMTTQGDNENSFFGYFNTTTSIILALLTTVSTFLDFDVQKAKHRSSSLGYGKLAMNIDRFMRLQPDERSSFGKTLAKINEQYGELRREAPFLKSTLIKEYIKKFSEHEQINETHDSQTGLGLLNPDDSSETISGDDLQNINNNIRGQVNQNEDYNTQLQSIEGESFTLNIFQEEFQRADQDRARIAVKLDKILDKLVSSENEHNTPLPTTPSPTNNNDEASTSTDHISLEIPELNQT